MNIPAQYYNTYFNWSANAILGLDLVATDNYLRTNKLVIKLVAQKLLAHIGYKPHTIYRGIILQEPLQPLELKPHPNFTYLSFSEERVMAEHFADHTESGFGSLYDLGTFGYVIEYTPRIEEVLWHYQFAHMLPYAKAFTKSGIPVNPTDLVKQREICILQPVTPFSNIKPHTKNDNG